MWTMLAVLFIATATHATLGKVMCAYGYPRGTPHDHGEIQATAQLMYYGCDLAELLLSVAFFAAWFRIGNHRRPGPSADQTITVSAQ
jgi:putative membrane protein